MTELLAQILPKDYVPAAVWVFWGLIALIAILIVWKLVRLIRRPRAADGRRSKAARLAVTDAAAIDPHRRLVLVRRDDVEHLIMIGGPQDLVIEQEIRRHTSARSAATPAAVTPTPVNKVATLPETVAVPKASAAPASAPPQAAPAPVAPAAAPASVSPSIKAPAVGIGAAAGAVGAATASTLDTIKTQTTTSVESSLDKSAELFTDPAASVNVAPPSPAPEPKTTEKSETTKASDDISSLLDDISAKRDG